MIYTLTFNPALDYIMVTGDINIGKTNRSQSETIVYGGKGINVSVMLSELGTENTAIAFAAGFTGRELENSLKEKNINTRFIYLKSGMTRINVKLPGIDTEINAAGPAITEEATAELMLILDTLTEADTLVLAGSVPPSLPKNIYEQIMARLYGKGVRFVVDAEGELLVNTLKYKPFLIKPNIHELSAIVGRELSDPAEIHTAARSLIEKGAENVLVSMGGDGAMLFTSSGETYTEKAHKITVKSTVGAGDSMVAGFIAGVTEKSDLAYALRLGSAAGAATASENGIAKRENVLNLLKTNN